MNMADKISHIQPFVPSPRTLMGPGPSDVHPRVLAAMARPTIGHLDPQFIGLMDEIKALLQYTFQTDNPVTFPISAPGSVGMEACFANLVEPGDKVVVCQNGVFGGRMKENVERCGGNPVMVEDDWGSAIDLEKVETTLSNNPDTQTLAFVGAETSTGAMSDTKALTELARKHGCLTIVDAVTSLGGTPVLVDEWGIDAVYSGFLDLNLILGYWGSGKRRTYHHTAPVNPLYGLHESLVMLKQEGLENAWARHQRNHLTLKTKLEALGINFLVSEKQRLPQLNTVIIPEGIDDTDVRNALLKEYNLEIGAGLGGLAGKVWRIGLMGYSSSPENILLCAGALESLLNPPISR